MFTRNFYKYLSGFFINKSILGTTGALTTHAGKQTGNTLYSGSVSGFEPSPYYVLTGIQRPRSLTLSTDHVIGSTNDAIGISDSCVLFGNGTDEPSIDDYTLSGESIAGLTISFSLDTQRNDDGSGSSHVVLYTITNNNEEAITISEIGIFVRVYWQSSSSSSTKYTSAAVLVERTLLETPITIEAGGVGQVTYTLEFNIL